MPRRRPLLLAAASAPLIASRAGADSPLLPDFDFTGDDSDAGHFEFGRAMGAAYAAAIQERMAVKIQPLAPLIATADGRRAYDAFLATHRRLVPQLVREVEGIAAGSNVSFETVFAVNIQQELGYYADPALYPGLFHEDHCSDYTMCTPEHCVGGHNEDYGEVSMGKMHVVRARLGAGDFTALSYAGDLPSGSCGFNQHGIGFTLNWVGPPRCDPAGLGRGFVSRLLLDAQGWDDAVATATRRHAGGHNYQLFDFAARRAANVEAANGESAVTNITAPAFHANSYVHLPVPGQHVSTSSAHRSARAAALPVPRTSADVLRVLGDQADTEWTIYHDAVSHSRGDRSDWTIETLLFDLDDGIVQLMGGNPAAGAVKRTLRAWPAR